jgi:hypothetical protein
MNILLELYIYIRIIYSTKILFCMLMNRNNCMISKNTGNVLRVIGCSSWSQLDVVGDWICDRWGRRTVPMSINAEQNVPFQVKTVPFLSLKPVEKHAAQMPQLGALGVLRGHLAPTWNAGIFAAGTIESWGRKVPKLSQCWKSHGEPRAGASMCVYTWYFILMDEPGEKNNLQNWIEKYVSSMVMV